VHVVPVVVGIVVAAVLAGFVYLGRERLGMEGAGLAVLRTAAFSALLVALINPGCMRRQSGSDATVLLDASLSFDTPGGKWDAAVDSARALAGSGPVLRFGTALSSRESERPTDGASRLDDALRAAVGRGQPVVVVTDGEIDDAASLPPSLLHRVRVVSLPRDTVPNAALLDVVVPDRVLRGDTIDVSLVVGTWGALSDTAVGRIDAFVRDRRVYSGGVLIPASPGRARRSVSIPPSALAAGDHVVRFVLDVSGDVQSTDNVRLRRIRVSDQPGVVVLIDPADVEGRFLVRELAEVVPAGVRGYGRIAGSTWLDVSTAAPVDEATVEASARNAVLVVLRGGERSDLTQGARGLWHWPAASDPRAELFEGDWYVTETLPPSPVAARLASLEWDSLPPLSGIVPVAPGSLEWVGITGRLGRRGADQPLLMGHDSAGVRRLTTASTGFWRWALRGGAAREAYRTFIASGIDWLLGTGGVERESAIVASSVVQRGLPVVFRHTAEEPLDTAVVTVQGADTTRQFRLQFDAAGTARITLAPGVYQWSVPGVARARGIVAVEEFSDEFPLAPVTLSSRSAEVTEATIVAYARENWWLFSLAVVMLLFEWGWRQRRGLP
jgi:hypothetical protein